MIITYTGYVVRGGRGGGGEKGLDRVRLHLDPTECSQAFIPDID